MKVITCFLRSHEPITLHGIIYTILIVWMSECWGYFYDLLSPVWLHRSRCFKVYVPSSWLVRQIPTYHCHLSLASQITIHGSFMLISGSFFGISVADCLLGAVSGIAVLGPFKLNMRFISSSFVMFDKVSYIMSVSDVRIRARLIFSSTVVIWLSLYSCGLAFWSWGDVCFL